MSIFDYVEQEKYQYTDFVKERMMDKYRIIWKFNNGDLAIRITGGTSRKKAASIKLEFVGNVRQNFKSINVGVFSEQWEDKYLKLMWDEVHTAVQELSSYDSLMPLYGHFTEPYPKFTIKLDIKYTSEVIEFQKQAIKEDNLKGVMPYSTISLDSDLVTEKLKFMRDYGFDVRTNNTNRTIPEEYFRICYPFTLPK